MAKFVKVAQITEVPPQTMRSVEAEGKRICLVNIKGQIFAVDETCTHEGGPMSEGTIEGQEIECPWHAARFCAKTGEVRGGPAYEPLASYPVRVSGDQIEVEV